MLLAQRLIDPLAVQRAPVCALAALRGHLASEVEYYSRTKQQGSGEEEDGKPPPVSGGKVSAGLEIIIFLLK